MYKPDEPGALRDLLEALRKVVPLVAVENGMERSERHIKIDDDPSLWQGCERLKGAAGILELGELEAAAYGDPQTGRDAWNDHKAMIQDNLRPLMETGEQTEGSDELSRATHAREASELLKTTDRVNRMMSAQMPHEADRTWLDEVIAEVAFLAFEAGRHTQAAWGKEFESFAVTRQRQIDSLRIRNEGRSEYNRQRKKLSADWRQHARQVEKAFPIKTSRKSERAAHIRKHWDKVGEEELRPSRPEQKTIQNWLSS